jgi:large subunit ribosomal protein L24e
MPRCSFCKQNYEFPYGLTYVLSDGNILYFCSSKCRKNMLKLKRDSKKIKWIKKFKAEDAEENKEEKEEIESE